MDVKLKHGGVLVVAVLDRIERRPLGVMGKTTEWTTTGGSGEERHIGGVKPPNWCSSMIHGFVGSLRFQTNIDFARRPDPYWMLAFATHPFCDSLSGMPISFPGVVTTMKIHTVVFDNPIDKFELLLERLRKCQPFRMETRSERHSLRKEVKERVSSDKGIYVFYRDEVPLYVGRTDQMAERLLNHGGKPSASAPSSATFALILAKYEFKKAYSVEHSLFSKELGWELNNHRSKKMELWMEAVEQVKRMSVRVVEVTHPHEQAVFEVYVHERLETPFNSFVNH